MKNCLKINNLEMVKKKIIWINRNYWLTIFTITSLLITSEGLAQQTLSLGRNNTIKIKVFYTKKKVA